MKKGNRIAEIKAHAEKRQQLEQDIRNLERNLAAPENTLTLKPDKEMQKEIDQAAFDRQQEQIYNAYERLADHQEQAKEWRTEQSLVSDEGEKAQNVGNHYETSAYEWLYDPGVIGDYNVLTHTQTEMSIAQIEHSNDAYSLDSREANARLILNNYEYGRWQDVGVHHYDDAIAFSEYHAAGHEEYIQSHDPGFDHGIDYDDDL